MSTKYRYEIQEDSLGDFRRTMLSARLDVLDPDGFNCDEETGDAIIAAHGWNCTKTPHDCAPGVYKAAKARKALALANGGGK